MLSAAAAWRAASAAAGSASPGAPEGEGAAASVAFPAHAHSATSRKTGVVRWIMVENLAMRPGSRARAARSGDATLRRDLAVKAG